MPPKEIKEQETQEKVEVEQKEQPVKEAPKDEKAEQVPAEKKEDVKETETKTEEKEVEQEPQADKEGEGTPVVEEEVHEANAIKVSDLMTKDEFYARIDALNAKIDAVMKENENLKAQNAELLDGKTKAEEMANQMKDKYENHSFGNYQKQGVVQDGKGAGAYQSFDDYSKQFM